MLARAFWVVFAISFAIGQVASAQDVKPKAMTREEIEKELEKNKVPVRGQVLQAGKVLCSLDSSKAQGFSAKSAGGNATTWGRTGPLPALALRLTPGSDLNRIVLVKHGALDSPLRIVFARSPGNALQYDLKFERPLSPGDYEFAISSGSLLLFPQCGFTVTTSSK